MTTGTRSNRKRNVGLAIVLILVASTVAGYFMRRREIPLVVETEKVALRNLTEVVLANGKIQPVVQVTINPEVSGEIIALAVKEGQLVKAGELLLKLKPDNYIAGRNSSEANYKSAQANVHLAEANLQKSEVEFQRHKKLFEANLVSDSDFLSAKTALEVQKATHETSIHGAAQAKAALARAEDDLSKTTINSPLDGTITKLRSQLGERVVGTAMMAGTEIMTIANLNAIEARVDIGEIDIPLLVIGQVAHLEIDAFRDRKFKGHVTDIANASKNAGTGSSSSASAATGSTEATKFEVKILLTDKDIFRPGMSVTAEIETRSRSNVITIPIQSVTTRLPKKPKLDPKKLEPETDPALTKQKAKTEIKPDEVVFLIEELKAKITKVKTGISDNSYIEVTEGLSVGQEVVSGGYKMISRDLEDGKKVQINQLSEGLTKP